MEMLRYIRAIESVPQELVQCDYRILNRVTHCLHIHLLATFLSMGLQGLCMIAFAGSLLIGYQRDSLFQSPERE